MSRTRPPGRHSAGHFDAITLSEAVTWTEVMPSAWLPPSPRDATQAFAIPAASDAEKYAAKEIAAIRRLRSVMASQPGDALTSPGTGREAVHLTASRAEPTPIGDSIPDEYGRFTLTCCHCPASHADRTAPTFARLHETARAKGWRPDMFGAWVCARDVRTNPRYLPQMPPAERTRAA